MKKEDIKCVCGNTDTDVPFRIQCSSCHEEREKLMDIIKSSLANLLDGIKSFKHGEDNKISTIVYLAEAIKNAENALE